VNYYEVLGERERERSRNGIIVWLFSYWKLKKTPYQNRNGSCSKRSSQIRMDEICAEKRLLLGRSHSNSGQSGYLGRPSEELVEAHRNHHAS